MPYFHGACICSLQWKITYPWADFPLLWGLIEMAALLSHPRELWVKIWCRLHLLMVEITSWPIGLYMLLNSLCFCLNLSSLAVVKKPFLALQLQPDCAYKAFGAEAGKRCVPLGESNFLSIMQLRGQHI